MDYEEDVSVSSDDDKKNVIKNEDEFDDDDELDLDMSRAGSKMWLVRVPKFLMEKWRDLDSLGGRDLGKIRVRNSQSETDPWKVKLVLNEGPQSADVPREYDVNLVKKVVDNTMVFTERDLPSYKKGSVKEEASVKEESKDQAGKAAKFNPNTRFTPYVKTIPKKTALVGTINHECMVTPSLTDKNYSRIVRQRKDTQVRDTGPKVTFLQDTPGVNAASFGGSFGSNNMFIRAHKRDPKNSDGKATRIPENELLDLLFKLFEEYDYWTMKGLRERTRQPETYLKDVLEQMAILIKKGPYAMKYTLKPEFKQMKGTGSSLSEFMGRDKEDDDMEDVL